MITRNENANHTVILFVTAEVHEKLSTGECSGDPVHKITNKLFSVDGNNKYIAINKLNEILEGIKEKCH